MSNPFLRRATEYIRDDSAFLAIVSPEPLSTFLAKHPKKDAVFDMPVRVIGTPGSGKTMMATLVEFRLVETILRDQSSQNNRALAAVLTSAGFSDGEVPLVAAVRIPMESEYRDYWELPFEESIRTKLVLSLIQARAVLSLVRNLTANQRRDVDDITFIPRGSLPRRPPPRQRVRATRRAAGARSRSARFRSMTSRFGPSRSSLPRRPGGRPFDPLE
ncbi:MAG: hypothetical protein AB7S70_07730 [Hyphomicrobium sp.]